MRADSPITESVPVVDIAPFLNGGAAEKHAVARAVARVCGETGFLIVSGHGIAEPVLDAAFTTSRAFFDRDQRDKDRWHPRGPARQRGYHALATRGLANTLDKSVPPDLRETVFLGPIDDHRAYYASLPEATTAYAENIYPDAPADFSPALTALYRAYERLSSDLLRIFATALDLPEDAFAAKMDRHFSILSSHHYPPLSEPPEAGQLRTGAHTDFGAFTILAMTDALGGLEVLSPRGDWLPVAPPEGALVVNLGDMMARWTNDRWKSTLHRVVNPDRLGAWESRRQSIGFFAHPNFDATIECIASCLGPGEDPRYPPITAGGHIAMKIAKSHAA